MNLADFTSQEKIFIDSNIFLYDALNVPEYVDSVKGFLKRIEAGEQKGATSVLVLNEVWYKLILSEAAKNYSIKPKEVIGFLKTKPEVIATLVKPQEALDKIHALPNLEILNIELKMLPSAMKLSKKYFLLTSDALHVATMELHGIKHIATNDADFERVDFLKVWKP